MSRPDGLIELPDGKRVFYEGPRYYEARPVNSSYTGELLWIRGGLLADDKLQELLDEYGDVLPR